MSSETCPVVQELIHQKESSYRPAFFFSPDIMKDLNNKSTTVTFFGLGLFFIILFCVAEETLQTRAEE